MPVTVGSPVPSASLVALGEAGPQTVNTSDLKGETTVLLFFPLVNTGVCEKELCTIRDTLQQYKNLKARVIAISVDSPFAQKLWAEKEGFQYEFWSDFNKEAIQAFDCAHEELVGLKGVAKRSAFVVGPDGTIRYAWVSDDPKVLPSFDEIQAVLKNES
ncbi:MAG: peroxiredoxin [Candidatus Hydrogenedentota bacterium]|nr:MAG: peroxiredoxin [Candidatus Hydrogenedentota bacterium]